MFIVSFWRQLDTRARLVLGVIVSALVLATVAGIVWVATPRYQVLFSDLAAEDAAVMTAELDRMKTPYKLNDDGTAILVAPEAVHKTRLKLLAKNLPLHGAVGFELFNGADFGMTDFAQKVNYQRALQGEITRTILSVDGIQSARVILALPEQQLFKKSDSKPKASINLVLKPGESLSHDQVNGIARLVSAAVPDIALQDVTIVDQHGITLTGVASGSADPETDGAAGAALELKKSTEAYLAHKLNDVLNQTFGPGKAIARVDVTLDMDRVQRTREQLLPAGKDAATGVLVKERSEGEGGGAAPLPPLPGAGASAGPAAPTSERHEREYQVGRDVEQSVSTPGTVRRIAIAAVVNDTLDAAQVARLKDILAATAGYDPARGDTIALYPFGQLASLPQGAAPAAEAANPDTGMLPASSVQAQAPVRTAASARAHVIGTSLGWLLGGLALVIGLAGIFAVRLFGARSRHAAHAARPLDSAQRAVLLADMQRWLAAETPNGTPQ
jgi:flagellar M-ring protein FliF